MSTTLNLSLTDELLAFIDANCGDGKPCATPSQFVCNLLHDKKLESEALAARNAIVAGYRDAIAGRIVPFEGNLRALLDRTDGGVETQRLGDTESN